jgi:FAD:protein FMN transferase
LSSLDLLEREAASSELVARGRAMATRLTVRVPALATTTSIASRLDEAVARALAVFSDVDRTCTRFIADSPLMRANRSPARWHVVPRELFCALSEAKRAHDATAGRFDPRVLDCLVALGYDRTLPFERGDVAVDRAPLPRRASRPGPWRPRFRSATSEVLLGRDPVDLGGIGKGLAVRWASDAMRSTVSDFLVEAGGDCYCAGEGPDEGVWLVGVEDPNAPAEHVAVLALRDRAATTSSVRLRRWRAGGERVHHLIDPATGRPGGRGLLSVTVVGDDPATAEVWSKALFVAGAAELAALADRRHVAALWVTERGDCRWSPSMERYVRWHR